MSIVYARNSQTLDTAITTVRNVKGKLVMINESKQVYTLEDQIAQLSKQVNVLARRRFQRILTFNPFKGSNTKKEPLYFNC